MNFSTGLVKSPEKDLDFDGHLLHILGSGEGKVVKRLNFDVVFYDFLDAGDAEVVALLHDAGANTLPEFVENDRTLSGVDLVDEGGGDGGEEDGGAKADELFW
jgi:hypothetical protein